MNGIHRRFLIVTGFSMKARAVPTNIRGIAVRSTVRTLRVGRRKLVGGKIKRGYSTMVVFLSCT